jgi:hypothetical protein
MVWQYRFAMQTIVSLATVGAAVKGFTWLIRQQAVDKLFHFTSFHFTSYADERYRDVLLKGCGEICHTEETAMVSKRFVGVRKRVDCMGLYSNFWSDAPAVVWPPPKHIPLNLSRDYQMGGKVTIHPVFLQTRYSGSTAARPIWSKKLIEDWKRQASNGTLDKGYGLKTCQNVSKALRKHQHRIHGKHVAVIGSETPWLEVILLAFGAKHVTTIEYGTIESQHPQISTMIPAKVRNIFLASGGSQPRFDAIATYSSLEHSGLGRYGDTLNPWGDLQAVAKAWCITKTGGSMFMGVPSGPKDVVIWNAHRIYGPSRWPHLMANYKLIDPEVGMWPKVAGLNQPMHAFDRLDAPPALL